MMEQKTEYINYFVATMTRNNFSATDIHSFLVEAWGEANVKSIRRIQEISKDYKDNERISAKRKEGSGGRPSICVDANVNRVREIIDNDNTVSVRYVARQLDISEKSAHRILKQKMALKCVYARWVPYTLTEMQQQQRVECAQNLLEDLNGNVIIIDEKWLYARPLPPRQHVVAWVAADGDRPRMARRIIADLKFHIIVAVTFRGDYSFSVIDRNQSINAELYVGFLQEKVIPMRRNLTIMHDNARPHTAIMTRNFFEENDITHLRQAPYSPDFNLLDRYVFRNMEFDRRHLVFETKQQVVDFLTNFMNQKMTRAKLQRELERLRSDLEEIIAIDGDYL